LEATNARPEALDRSREARLHWVLTIKEMNIKVVDPVPSPQVLKGRSLAKACADETRSVRLHEMRVADEKVCLFGYCEPHE
jgi:hypothetical protein